MLQNVYSVAFIFIFLTMSLNFDSLIYCFFIALYLCYMTCLSIQIMKIFSIFSTAPPLYWILSPGLKKKKKGNTGRSWRYHRFSSRPRRQRQSWSLCWWRVLRSICKNKEKPTSVKHSQARFTCKCHPLQNKDELGERGDDLECWEEESKRPAQSQVSQLLLTAGF